MSDCLVSWHGHLAHVLQEHRGSSDIVVSAYARASETHGQDARATSYTRS